MKIRQTLLYVVTITVALCAASAQQPKVTRAYADDSGAVHVVCDDGKERIIHKQRGSVGASEVKVASDLQTVGWLVDWPNPDESQAWRTMAGTLVIWRNGKIVRRFQPGPAVFWGWNFWDGGTQVGYEIGAMHFSNGDYELRDIATGSLLAHCYYNEYDEKHSDPGEMPDWAKAVHE
jgi:hypothetical protein